MQKIDLEQAKEKEVVEAKHKLSQKEQEIETIKVEVSLVCEGLKSQVSPTYFCRRWKKSKQTRRS